MSALSDPRRLEALSRASLLDTLPEPAFDRLTRIAGQLLNAPVALISLVDTGRQFFTGEIALREEIRRRQEAERQQRLLIAELHHRVKNTLAVVQSIIVMSLRSAKSLADFRDSISARIVSLANTHTLLLNQNAVATSLCELLQTELSAHHMEGRIVLEGPDAELPSQTAVSLGMCIHELMTNASKHGALSVPAGRVRLTWRAEDGDNLRLLWVESGGPTVTEPSHTGFGTTLLKRVMKSQTSGNVTLDFRPRGLQAEILLHVPPPRQE